MHDLRFLVLSPSMAPNDAIANDVLLQRDLLRSFGYEAEACSSIIHEPLKHTVQPLDKVAPLLDDPKTTVIYHHGVYWAQGPSIIERAKGPTYLRYHNITPAMFFLNKDLVAHHATEEGIRQTRNFVSSGNFRGYLGCSKFNLDELLHLGADPDKSFVVPPFHRIDEFDQIDADEGIASQLKSDARKKILFIGRMAPNKGHVHLVRTISRYIDLFGDDIVLNVVGDFAYANEIYLKEIEDAINQSKVADFVNFVGKTSFAGIKAYYQESDVFLLLSEHEGFCVPIIEAQSLGLPIVALGMAAVPETLGLNQLVHYPMDYEWFATAIRQTCESATLRTNLLNEGAKNLKRYSGNVIAKKFLASLGIDEPEKPLEQLPWLSKPSTQHPPL